MSAKRYAKISDSVDHVNALASTALFRSLGDAARGEQGVVDDSHELIETPFQPNYALSEPFLNYSDAPIKSSSDMLLEPVMNYNEMRFYKTNVIPFDRQGQTDDQPQVGDGQNMAKALSRAKLAELGMRVRRTYDIDLASRADWMKGFEKALDLVDSQKQAKEYPIEGASNIKYPLLTMASLQFAARAYPAIVRSGDVVKMKVEGFEPSAPQIQLTEEQMQTPEGQKRMQLEMMKAQKTERGIRVGRYMSWQLRSQMKNWEDETDTMLHQLPLVGCCFRKVYDDAALKHKRSLLLSSKDVVINMKARSVEDAARVTQRFEMYPFELQECILSGEYLDIREDIHLDSESMEDNQAPIEFLEQHCRYDLDGDDYDEPLIITVHKATGTIARIENNFDQDDVKLAQNGKIASIRPTQIFVKYDFLPNPRGGIYGVGFGHILRDITDGINTTLNQIFDAAHLQNSSGGFLGKGIKFGRAEQGEQLHVKQNRFHYVSNTGGDLRQQIVPFEHKGPSPVLGLLIDAGKEVSAVKDVLTGDTGGSANMPVGTILALIEQGLQVFTAIYKRTYRSLSKEFQILFRLNEKRLDAEEYMAVTDDPKASPEDFQSGNHDLTPVADPTAVTDMQQVGRAQFLAQYLEDPALDRKKLYLRIFDAAKIDEPEELFAGPNQVAEQAQQLELRIAAAEAAEKEANSILRKAQAVERLSEAAEHRVNANLSEQQNVLKAVELDMKERAGERKYITDMQKLTQTKKVGNDT